MTTTEGCIDTLNLLMQDLISVNPSPIANFSVNPEQADVCQNEVSFINQSTGATTYQYIFDHQGFYTETPDFIHQYQNSGTDYPLLLVANEFGCKDSIRKTVMVFPFTIYVPNTFIPDEDGKNDVFKAETTFEINEWEFEIYNRWGQRVYYSDQLTEGWNGTYQGLDCPDGVYSYKIRYRGCEFPSAWQLITGSVRLLR
jgi:gliding motility-associated-like protein